MRPLNILYFIIAVLVLMNFNGCCTLLGFVIGSTIDSKSSKQVVKSESFIKLEKIDPKTRLKVKLRDSQIMVGKFQGIERGDSSEYVQRYTAFRDGLKNKELFPAINDTVVIRQESALSTAEQSIRYIFSGFDMHFIKIRSVTEDNIIIGKNFIDMNYIEDKQGKKINLQIIKRYIDKGYVPLQSELVLQTDWNREEIPIERVEWIELPRTYTGRIICSLVGLGADIIIFAVITKPLVDKIIPEIIFGPFLNR